MPINADAKNAPVIGDVKLQKEFIWTKQLEKMTYALLDFQDVILYFHQPGPVS
jgi:hypothetical protein